MGMFNLTMELEIDTQHPLFYINPNLSDLIAVYFWYEARRGDWEGRGD